MYHLFPRDSNILLSNSFIRCPNSFVRFNVKNVLTIEYEKDSSTSSLWLNIQLKHFGVINSENNKESLKDCGCSSLKMLQLLRSQRPFPEENRKVPEIRMLRKSQSGRVKRKEKEVSTTYGNKQCLKNKLKLVVNSPFSPGMDMCVIKISRSVHPYGLVRVL